MKQYSYYKAIVGEEPVIIPPIYAYYAYSNGEVKVCNTKAEATGFSENIERFFSNKKEHTDSLAEYHQYQSKVGELWLADLRKEYDYLSDEVFEECYSEAYDRGHSSGYDEVVNYLDETTEFARRIIAAHERTRSE